VALGLIKASLCIFYLEIFSTRPARIVSYIILTWIVINTLIIFLLTIFSCNPVPAWWNRDLRGKCLDITALAYANSASAIAQDVVLVVFPLACIRRLNMKRYRKLAVGFMFSIGTLYVMLSSHSFKSNLCSGCIATMARLHTLLSFKTTIDPTWDYVPVTIWTELELACGFVCVSLPAVRVLVVRIIPKSLITSITSKSRSRSAQTPNIGSDTQKLPHKRLSWIHISTDHDDETTINDSKSRSSRLWPPKSPQSRTRSQTHQRLGSTIQEETANMSHLRTCTQSVPREHHGEERDQVLELQPVAPSRARHPQVCYSCRPEDEEILALPKIGCLPDESFSEGEPEGTSSCKREYRWWEEVRSSYERSKFGHEWKRSIV
jgi:hypothetical protein